MKRKLRKEKEMNGKGRFTGTLVKPPDQPGKGQRNIGRTENSCVPRVT